MPTPAAALAVLTTPQLETELLSLAGHIAAAQCRFLQLLAEFDRRKGWAGPGLTSCGHWLSWRIGMSLRTAAEHVRVAHALAELPAITAEFAAGRLSYSKVRAITRLVGRHGAAAGSATTTDPTNPADAGNTGTTGTASTGGPATTTAARNSAAATGTGAGTATGTATGTGTGTGPTPHSADATADTDAAAGLGSTAGNPPGDATAPSVAVDQGVSTPALAPDAEHTLLALALAGTASHVEKVVRATRRRQAPPELAAAQRSVSWRWADDGSLVLRGRFAAAEGSELIAAIEALVRPRQPVRHPVPASPPDWRARSVEESPGAVADRVGAQRADALLALAAGPSRPAAGGRGEPTVARGQARLVVHIDATTSTAAIDDGPEIPIATAERLACDARVQVLLQDRSSNRLYLGRSRRLATPAQIAALTIRDGARCQFSGCTHTRHLHAHHVRHWLRGGRTDLDNLVLLCSFHHTVVHDRGYGAVTANGGWAFHRPDGTPIPDTGPPLVGNVESLIEISTRAELRITRDSLTPTWAGERLDPEPILDALLPYAA